MLGDHVDLDEGRRRPRGNESLGLEDASQVRSDDWQGGCVKLLGHAHVRPAREQTPPLNKWAKHLSVEPSPAAIEIRVLRLDATFVAMNARKDLRNRIGDPVELSIGDRHRFDGERTVSAGLVLPDEAIRLEPAG